MHDEGRLDRSGRAVVALLFFVTGAAALVDQVTWQRVIALHSGVDLESGATVVAAFLGGLGVGSVLGGRLADRLTARRALVALAVANLGVGAYSAISTWLLYDVYREVAGGVDLLVVRLAFNGLVLLVPTTLMGTSLPLVARAITTDPARAGSQIGRFNAANAAGAALGAAAGGWFLLGEYGFVEVTRLVAGTYVVVAAVLLGLAWAPSRRGGRTELAIGVGLVVVLVSVVHETSGRLIGDLYVDRLARLDGVGALVMGALAFLVGLVAFLWPAGASVEPAPAAAPAEEAEVGGAATPGDRPAWHWYLVYAGTGAVALAFEQVFFRLVDGIMRSNTYTFGHVLSIYLGLLAVGTAIGSWVRPRVRDERRAFLWLQFGVGLSAVLTLVVVTRVLPSWPFDDRFERWFESDGFAGGFEEGTRTDRFLFGLALPVFVMAGPVLLMGAAFPFVQSIVTRDLATVGRRTGTLLAANLLGNVGGALVGSFVLIELLGTAGSYRVLVLPLAAAGVVAALGARGKVARRAMVAGVVAVVALGAALVPSNDQLWATLHGTSTDDIVVAEDRSCASALELYGGGSSQLTINGAGQNGYPFDDFHVLIGLVPALAHPEPEEGLAIGLGIGSTSYAMLASDRLEGVTSVELCGGNYELVDDQAAEGLHEFEVLRDDPRHHEVVGDGRRHLLAEDGRRWDLVVPDTVRPNSAGSGNLFSREFQELVRSRLAPGGITAGWIPSYRALNAVTVTFPYVQSIAVPAYNDSAFYLASDEPIELDRATLLERFDQLAPDALSADQRASLRAFLAALEPECVNDGRVAVVEDPTWENRDLHPRDEYSLSNGGIPEDQVARTCGP